LPIGSEWIEGLFYALRGCLNDYSFPINPTLILDWQRATGDLIPPEIAVIIIAMDRAYRQELHELQDKITEARRE